jgi:enoyl-CoA hydratase/carnithine racemase
VADAVRFEYSAQTHIAKITLNRPEKMNAINLAMRRELQEAFTEVKDNPDIWLLVVTGEGRAFCSGKDLVEKLEPAEDTGVMSNEDLYVFQRNIYKPIIAAINGPCLAQGAGIGLGADIRIMSERATLGWPQVKRGISSVSGPSMFAHEVPVSAAMKYLLRGVPMTPREAFDLHVVSEIAPHDELMDVTHRWATEILACSPVAVMGMKEAVVTGLELPLQERVRNARRIANRVLQSEDSQEGILAFREKREPQWLGR